MLKISTFYFCVYLKNKRWIRYWCSYIFCFIIYHLFFKKNHNFFQKTRIRYSAYFGFNTLLDFFFSLGTFKRRSIKWCFWVEFKLKIASSSTFSFELSILLSNTSAYLNCLLLHIHRICKFLELLQVVSTHPCFS